MPRYGVRAAEVGGEAVLTMLDAEASFSVAVCPRRGGQVVGAEFQGTQLVHRALNFDAPPGGAWGGHAPVLFPAVGRQRDATYTLHDCKLHMPLHGFVMNAAFTVCEIEHDDTLGASCTVELRAADLPADLLKGAFPFEFTLRIKYTVLNGALSATHTVQHIPGGGASLPVGMPVAIGNHLTLAFPFYPSRGTWESGRLHSTASYSLGLTPGSLLDGSSTLVPDLLAPAGLPLTAPLSTNAVLSFAPAPAPASTACTLDVEQPGVLRVRMTQEFGGISRTAATDGSVAAAVAEAAPSASRASSDEISAHRYFVLWGEAPAAGELQGFICPEPWLTGPDSLNTRAGLPVLYPGEQMQWSFTMTPVAL